MNGESFDNTPKVTGSEHHHSGDGYDALVSTKPPMLAKDTDCVAAPYTYMTKGKGPKHVEENKEHRYVGGFPYTEDGLFKGFGRLANEIARELAPDPTEKRLDAAVTIVGILLATGPMEDHWKCVGK